MFAENERIGEKVPKMVHCKSCSIGGYIGAGIYNAVKQSNRKQRNSTIA